MSEFIFKEEGHEYTLDGIRLPSNTEVLAKDGLVDFSMVDPEILEAARIRGTWVHKACHYYDEGDLDWESIKDKPYEGYVRGYVKFTEDYGLSIIAVEKPIYHRTYLYATTPDIIGKIKTHPEPAVIDRKTGLVEPWVGLQLAAQEAAARLKYNLGPCRRYALNLKPDATYKLIPFKDRMDERVFLSALAVVNWKTNHGYKFEGGNKNGLPIFF